MKKKLNIIFLLSNFKFLPNYQKEILNYTFSNNNIKLIQIIEIPEKKRPILTKSIINKIFLKLLILFEKIFLKLKKLNQDLNEVNLNLDKVKIEKIYPIRKKYSDIFNKSDIEKINKLKPEIIFNFSDRLIKGEILKIPKYGILSFHMSDTDFQRNGLGGFYEIIEKKEFTGITIQQLNDIIDGGLIANKKHFRTLKFYTLNHENLLKESLNVFKETIQFFIEDKIHFAKPKEYKKKLYAHPPTLKNIIKYFYLAYIR